MSEIADYVEVSGSITVQTRSMQRVVVSVVGV